MKPIDPPDDCVRRRVEIDGKNYYVVVGETFVDITPPRENRPENLKTRVMLETLCREITSIRENW